MLLGNDHTFPGLRLRGDLHQANLNVMKTYITIYKMDNQQEFAVWLRELKLGLDNNLEECGGTDVQVGGDMGKPMDD